MQYAFGNFSEKLCSLYTRNFMLLAEDVTIKPKDIKMVENGDAHTQVNNVMNGRELHTAITNCEEPMEEG